jgi:hypothetical protein
VDALMRDLLPVIEFAAKAARTALAHVGAAIDCGMPAASAQRAHAGAFDSIDSADLPPAETAPAGVSDGPEAPAPPAGLSWIDWATPAICDVLAVHHPVRHADILCSDGAFGCGDGPWPDRQAWREHVAALIAQRLETAALALDPAKAAREADLRITHALDLFEQHRKPQ